MLPLPIRRALEQQSSPCCCSGGEAETLDHRLAEGLLARPRLRAAAELRLVADALVGGWLPVCLKRSPVSTLSADECGAGTLASSLTCIRDRQGRCVGAGHRRGRRHHSD